jgi:methionyl-tRNA synthetase
MNRMDNKFYITTPIYYVNDKPHIGHAYSTIAADVLARWRFGQGEDVTFSTGVDENAQKTVDAAAKNNEEIHAYTDRMAKIWESTWQKLGISNTDFIRTTEDRHVAVVNDFWRRMEAAGDIYKGTYEGFYCVGCENFYKEEELTPDGLCPIHKTKPEWVSEENYYFALSKYQQPLLDFYAAHEDFVVPAHRFNEIKSFVEHGLEDVSFSREKKSWGIPVPDDPEQIIYVWADALVNYVTVIGGIEGWEQHPADVHMMAKDIARFHAIIWPAMLMSAGLPLPGQTVVTGFLTIDGVKISKSLGNVIDPLDLAAHYGNDAVRYFLLREIPFGADGDFSEAKMKERYNSDLANGLGNFAARILALAEKEELKSAPIDPTFELEIQKMQKAVFAKTKEFRFHEALAAIWAAIAFGDKYLNDRAVWAIKDEGERREKLFNLVSLLDNVAAVLLPYLPESSRQITAAIQWNGDILHAKRIEPLFPRIS